MIPAKFIVTGDEVQGRALIGFARDELRKLKRDMGFQELKEGFRTVRPFPGVVIECWSSFNLAVVSIYVQPLLPLPGGKRKKYVRTKDCLCLPHFAVGGIIDVIPEVPVIEEEESQNDFNVREAAYATFLLTGQFTYNVEVCMEDRYLLYEGMYSSGWGRYYEGQKVIVTVGERMDSWDIPLDCAKSCLSKLPRFDTLVICGIHVPGYMKKWKEYMFEVDQWQI